MLQGHYTLTSREDSSQNCKNVAKTQLCTNNSLTIQAIFLTMQNMIVFIYCREIAKNKINVVKLFCVV